jgi:hypothetical protein
MGKLPIYDAVTTAQPSGTQEASETSVTGQLTAAITSTRHSVSKAFDSSTAKVQETVDSVVSLESSIARGISSICDSTEASQAPQSLLSMTLAGFGTAILVKHRGPLARTLLPLLVSTGFGIGLFPKTLSNAMESLSPAFTEWSQKLKSSLSGDSKD